MLGWEFPPFISGGLGTACDGLTRAMSRQGTEVLFVLPKTAVRGNTGSVRTLASEGAAGPNLRVHIHGAADPSATTVTFRPVESRLISPYARTMAPTKAAANSTCSSVSLAAPGLPPYGRATVPIEPQGVEAYGNNLLEEVDNYATRCLQLAGEERFDVIHAHDWMTYPAGIALARATGKPLVVHVHSTESDRSGDNVDERVCAIEHRGMATADAVITVSQWTQRIVLERYGVDPNKIRVVYNGIDAIDPASHGVAPRMNGSEKADGAKIVLFLGRMTMQKGPQYFVEAAKKVLEVEKEVKFVMAGSGDLLLSTVRLAAELGIGHKVLFAGFLRGEDVDCVFRMASVYVMPSVSEPFGIAPLEAIARNVPVIVSKSSGVSEVLRHCLKVDFWDTHAMANQIVAVLRHAPLANTLCEHAGREIQKLSWDRAAAGCLDVYRRITSGYLGPDAAAGETRRPCSRIVTGQVEALAPRKARGPTNDRCGCTVKESDDRPTTRPRRRAYNKTCVGQ
ncbi:MAG: glycosyltransferase [Tepidisphaeraceae bacterium]|jgi:glycosyltransferase involved in cell wall biosynthesis